MVAPAICDGHVRRSLVRVRRSLVRVSSRSQPSAGVMVADLSRGSALAALVPVQTYVNNSYQQQQQRQNYLNSRPKNGVCLPLNHRQQLYGNNRNVTPDDVTPVSVNNELASGNTEPNTRVLQQQQQQQQAAYRRMMANRIRQATAAAAATPSGMSSSSPTTESGSVANSAKNNNNKRKCDDSTTDCQNEKKPRISP